MASYATIQRELPLAIKADAYERRRVARTVGAVLVIAAPALTFGNWYSTRQPLEMLAWSEQNRSRIPPEAYGSAVYMGSHAQRKLDEKWNATGFATLGLAGTFLGAGLLFFAYRRVPVDPTARAT